MVVETPIFFNPTRAEKQEIRSLARNAQRALKKEWKEVRHEEIEERISPDKICGHAIENLKFASYLIISLPDVRKFLERKGEEIVGIDLIESASQRYVAGVHTGKSKFNDLHYGDFYYGKVNPFINRSNLEDTPENANNFLESMKNDFKEENNNELITKLSNLTKAQIVKKINMSTK